MRQVGGRLFWVRSSLLSLLLLFVREGGFGWRIEKKGGEREGNIGGRVTKRGRFGQGKGTSRLQADRVLHSVLKRSERSLSFS